MKKEIVFLAFYYNMVKVISFIFLLPICTILPAMIFLRLNSSLSENDINLAISVSFLMVSIVSVVTYMNEHKNRKWLRLFIENQKDIWAYNALVQDFQKNYFNPPSLTPH